VGERKSISIFTERRIRKRSTNSMGPMGVFPLFRDGEWDLLTQRLRSTMKSELFAKGLFESIEFL
jgi:hypothetical protein